MLKKNDIIELKVGHSFEAQKIPYMFICDNGDYNMDLTHGDIYIDKKPRRGLVTTIFCGLYIVTKTDYTGGGTMLGVFGADTIPDGFTVWAKKVYFDGWRETPKISDFEIKFYQHNSYNTSNPDIVAEDKQKLEKLYPGIGALHAN